MGRLIIRKLTQIIAKTYEDKSIQEPFKMKESSFL